MLKPARFASSDASFLAELDKLLAWESVSDARVQAAVTEIVEQVRQHGDAAVLEYTAKFDGLNLSSAQELEVSQASLQRYFDELDPAQRNALQLAAQRVRDYHQHQAQPSWDFVDALGNKLGQKITPMDRVGVYVPGGKASYPSSVLMNVIPAKVAGVPEVIMVVPTPRGEVNPMVFAAAFIAGVDRVFTVGGAQAVAALAYGTQTIPAVDKIVGPGNIYVATAKRMVFGKVGIDMIAGPSEILVVCDGKTSADWIAMDLFSQAEHDEDAQSILISTDAAFLMAVETAMNKLLETQPRHEIIAASINSRAAFISVENQAQAIELINRIAPEHLELSVDEPESWLPEIRHAGAIFLGRFTPEALGDYCAGPNHVLPTSGTARFSSPLGVYDFQKRSSIIFCSADGASELAKTASVLARGESLVAHAESAEFRIKSVK